MTSTAPPTTPAPSPKASPFSLVARHATRDNVRAVISQYGIFLIFGPELLTHTPLSTLWFPLIVGSILIVQVILTPQGLVPDWQERFRKRFPPAPRFPAAEPLPDVAAAEAPTLVKV